ncbi:MAG: hypothetical protein EBU90_07275 [Proteobacteria bacterium]|nr:hypothetical protein [Pseudomonadota bacterium]
MPSPKSLRAAPPRTFENYILTLSVGPNVGLTKTPQEKFLQIPGTAGQGGQDDVVSDALDIGFTFSFDGRNHTKFRVCTNGWVILVAPGSTADANTTVSEVMDSSNQNESIKETFSANHVLCAVWFDDIRSLYSSTSGLIVDQKQIDAYEKGLSQPEKRLNPRKYGIQYYNDNLSNEGRRLIIRWHSISSYIDPLSTSILTFEFVLYENGKIEYRYCPRNDSFSSITSVYESATIGVFMPNGSWRFRDFSYELGYARDARSKYGLGGTVSGSYSEQEFPFTVPYGIHLNAATYWPGQRTSGAIFTFQPPLNRRKVLPRLSLREKDSRITLPTVSRTGDKDRSGSDGVYFDDRKSIAYGTNSSVNYPTTLPRFYASSLIDVSRNQDLFLEDFVLTGSVISSNVQEYLEDNEKKYIAPFSEYKLFENDPTATADSFFMTGSSIKDVGEGFSQPLRSKTQIRLSYRVDHKTTMFGASSSIYYFNKRTGRWQYPTASFAGGKFDIAEPFMDPGASPSGRLMEVDRGFNAIGFNIASGSSDRSTFPFSTNAYFNNYFNRESEIQLLTTKFEKSITLNQEYNANDDESITIPINQPFLLEKAVIEIPIEAGPGWFYDRTQCVMPTALNSPKPLNASAGDGVTFDIGGPGLTFGLFNQIKVGPNKYVRDLILSGVVTHQEDNSAKIAYFQPVYGTSHYDYPIVTGDVYQIVPRGFLAYATPSGIISGSNYFFTGSAKFKCQASISNGVLIRDTFFIDQDRVSYYDYATGSLEILFNSQKLKLPGSGEALPFNSIPGFTSSNTIGYGSRETILTNVNNMGRSMSGFEPSGRSVLGKEYTTSRKTNEYENPFYLYRDSIVKLDHMTTGPISESPKDLVTEAIPELGAGGGGAQAAIAISVAQKQNNTPSPYLLLPNDRLILSISKSRPFFLSTEALSPFTMNQIQHDIKLTTGSINITLYGSLVANGREFHDTLNQPLSSDAIHEVVIGGTNT